MMENFFIGTASYLPSGDLKKRRKRFDNHLKQLRYLKELYPGVPLVSVNQGYSDLEIGFAENAFGSKIENINYPNGIGIAKAKNILLDRLYESDYQYVLIVDDDISIYPYYDSANFFTDLCNYDKKIGFIRPLAPLISPFKKNNCIHRDIIEKSWILEYSWSFTPCGTQIIGNLPKFFNEKIYFDESLKAAEGEGYEDYDLVFQFQSKGLPSFMCKQLITRYIGNEDSSIFKDEETRRKLHLKNLANTYARYPNTGIRYCIEGNKIKTNIRSLSRLENQYVPRSSEYKFEPNLIVDCKGNLKSKEKKRLI